MDGEGRSSQVRVGRFLSYSQMCVKYFYSRPTYTPRHSAPTVETVARAIGVGAVQEVQKVRQRLRGREPWPLPTAEVRAGLRVEVQGEVVAEQE